MDIILAAIGAALAFSRRFVGLLLSLVGAAVLWEGGSAWVGGGLLGVGMLMLLAPSPRRTGRQEESALSSS